MADIELNVEVREQAGSGAARAVRRAGKVPGVLYGGPRGPVPIAADANAFGKALYTGKLLGHLNIARHDVELWVRADHIPEALVVDLAKRRIGDTIRISDIALPDGAEPVIADRDFMIATIATSSAQMAEDAAADEAVSEAQHEASVEEVEAAETEEGAEEA